MLTYYIRHDLIWYDISAQRSGRRESGGGRLRVTFSEEELEIHDEDDNMDENERTDDSPARWSKLLR